MIRTKKDSCKSHSSVVLHLVSFVGCILTSDDVNLDCFSKIFIITNEHLISIIAQSKNIIIEIILDDEQV